MIIYLKSHKFISLILVAFLIGVGFFVFKNENGKERFVVTRGEIIQEVAATGKVKPTQSVDLSFDKSGRVGAVYAFTGDFVKKGETIVSLEARDVTSDLSKARAVLDEELLKLRELERTVPLSYEDSIRALEVAIREAFVVSDNAVRNRADQFFKNIPQNPQFEVTFTDGNFIHYFTVPANITIALNNERKQIEDILKYWSVLKNNPSKDDLYQNTEKGIADMKRILTFLDNMAAAVNSFTPSNFTYETTVNNYKTSISIARSDVSKTLTALVTARDNFNNSPKKIDGSDNQFEEILVQQAKVNQARASLNYFEALLDKLVIKAPFDGVITLQDAKVGGTVSPGETLVSITSKQDFYIEANISEINIGKVSVGNNVSIKFDAFPDEEFRGFVSFIEPGDNIVEGVVNYKIRVEFGNREIAQNGQEIWRYDNSANEKIKNGLTANLKIEVLKKDNVVKVPVFTLTKTAEGSFVNKVDGKNKQLVKVETGVLGSDGFIEILNGLNEGDLIEF